ncbi:Vi polysaccharide biosynthesis UDP-N-acetylglucosamine C-6 dehydrogenase TviB [Hydrocarboniclastica marina]|uniref:Vi polysaccharide biosynthesis UDP-N-acetylglucosamine C-6 dehydrogenase TviB n=1 Tax=Hydrocarboniclastica marina TaxID=2259620 RepID=A0A4P7XIF4_9ALTE|nr:Vi polysaccharide biosynthesis UDP-N-acetylglucosamine C-6 dehydrogenase TviB [Hydrocarboniclastica marina]QCF26304.1 Vi polysaccharide biosynthesis UDP-N-acetylglucosamine C-6 dehydrogenase TviB [Hydrocarboniclastica marina]
MRTLKDVRIGMIGLGYVGLPLAVEFGKQFPTVGFDISEKRIRALQAGHDTTLEVEDDLLAAAKHLRFSSNLKDIRDCNVYIVTVPTPIDSFKTPDLRPLQSASNAVGQVLNKGDIVIYESTVYPGATEEVCIPILEKVSGLSFNQDFYAGYSPERINPGDKEHRVTNILKVTSGSTPEIADFIDSLYQSVITAGTFKATSIRVAEAAKVIENTQRDVNIALINELSLIFERLGIDTLEVLEAAGTKWNFLPFRPGMVGGHCIGVDPYYLTYKAQSVGYHPEMILSGRRINDSMGSRVAERVIKLMTRKRVQVVDSNILILGLTFKENCPDIRNTRVVDLVKEFESYHANVDVYDPWVNAEEVREEYGFDVVSEPRKKTYDAVILAVGHRQFLEMGAEGIRALGKDAHVLFDVKYLLPKDAVDDRL